jgi:hypothetical protein
MAASYGPISLDRMVAAVEDVRRRMLRAAAALDRAGVPYAVIGGNAVAVWVARVDKAAVRNTQDVDLLIRRSDLESAILALGEEGFLYRHVKGVDLFLDGPDAHLRDALHIIFAGEKVRSGYSAPAPDVLESESSGSFRVLALPALIRMKLTSFRLKDQMHLLDLIDVGLIDQSTVEGLPTDLAGRLQGLIDNPES